jgi:WD40 repeat protein/class 3 adenylate cyclase
MDRLPTGTVTFLFTDIEGSTWRWETQTRAMQRASARHDDIVRGAIGVAGGTVFSTAGDAFFAVFADARDALSAAIAAQRALAAEDWSASGAAAFDLRVRMGIHTGVAELRDGQYFGPPLNRAARLTAAGHGGQVLLTLAAEQLVRDGLPADCELRDLGVHRLQDLQYSEHIFQAFAPGMPAVTTPLVTMAQLATDEPPHVDAQLLAKTCPYRGLHAFREEDERFFFGRESFTARLVAAVAAEPVAAVIGPSGSGKSSVVFAGLVPQLRGTAGEGQVTGRGADGLVLSLRPGRRPFQALAGTLVARLEGPLDETDVVIKTGKLASALRRGHVRISDVLARICDRELATATPLLIADQFEELYTLCPDENEQHAFQDLLFEAALNAQGAPPLKLALTLRADFMGHALSYRSFADVVQGRDVVLGPMNRAELARAIARPAELQGRAFEAGLVERITDDVCQRTGALPLLEFALAQLWQRQEGGWLTHAGYESIGRVGGAIAQHADSIYDGLDEIQRAAARHVFVQLVRPGEGTEDTRRMATRDEMGDHWDLVHTLADARLVVANHDADNRETVELVHEALIQSWRRLRQWVDADRRFRQWQERLRFSLGQWERSDHDADALLRGATLARAEEWVLARGEELAPAERAFVVASAAERDRQEVEREAHRRREVEAANRAAEAERRRAEVQTTAARNMRLLSAGLIVAVIVAGIFWRNATVASQRADVQRLAAMARNVSLEGQPRRGLLLALEAQRRDTDQSGAVSAEVRESLRFALARVQGFKVEAVDAPITAAAISPGGNRFATGDAKGRVRLSGLTADGTLARQRDLGPVAGEVVGLAFDAREERLFGVDKGGTVRVWDLAAQAPAGVVVDRLTGPACSMKVDPTGRWLAVSGKYDELRLWDLAVPGSPVRPGNRISFLEDGNPMCVLAFDPSGGLLAAGDSEDQIKVWDLGAPDVAASAIALALHSSVVLDLAFSPDGQWLLSGGGDGTAQLIKRSALERVAAGTTLDATGFGPGTLRTLAAHENDVTGVVFAPDSTWFATADTGGTLRVWRLAAGQLTGPRMIERFRTAVDKLAATPDSRHLVAVSGEGAIAVWQMPPDAGRIRGYVLTGHDGRVSTLNMVRNGDWMFTGSKNGSVLRWGLGAGASGIEPLVLRGHADNVVNIAVPPDGRRFASASWDGTVKIWPSEQVLAGRSVAPVTLAGHAERATAVLIAPERLGDPACTVVTGDEAGNVRLWRFCTAGHDAEPTLLAPGLDDRVAALAAAPDGRWLVSGDGANRLLAWDLARPGPLGPPIQLTSEQGTPNVIRFADAGRALLSASGSGTVEEWLLDAPRPSLVRTYQQPGGQGLVRAMDYDDTSQTLLVGNTNGLADVWRRSGKAGPSTSLPWDGGRIKSVALAANGRAAVVAGESPYVRVWPDWSKPTQSEALLVSVEGANDIALSPNDQLLAVAGADGVVYTWTRDTAGGYSQRVALQGHEAPVVGVKILAGPAEGDLHLVSYDQAGEIRLWDLDWASLLDRACQAAGRNLTPDEEWPQYFPSEPWRPTCDNVN